MVTVRYDLEAPLNLTFFNYRKHERVGLIVGTSFPCSYFIVRRIVPVPNVKFTTKDDFAVSRRSIRLVESRYGTVIGCLHTHLPGTNEWPSRNDREGLPEGWVGCVLALPAWKFTWYGK